jgi:diguanylate cyclase (GGDEF)-like protein/PAS domain S-box-containing protein
MSGGMTDGAADDRLARAVLREMSDVVAIVDDAGRLRYVSDGVEQLLGYQVAEMIGMDAFDLVHPDDHAGALEGFESTLSASDSRPTPLLLRLRMANGEWLDSEVIATNRLADDDIRGLLLSMRDVSESMRTEQALRDSEAHYRLIVELAHEGIWVIDANAVTTYANRAMAEMLGTTVAALIGRSIFEFMDDDGRSEAIAKLERRVVGASGEHDFRLITADGRALWTRMNTSPLSQRDGTYTGAIALVADVTERRALEQRLAHEAQSDPLTGLANRNALFDEITRVLDRETLCGVLFADIDCFKRINDVHGHRAGDDVLRAVSKRLAGAVRGCDTVARVGGDEFVVVTPLLDYPGEAAVIARRVRNALSEPVRVADATIDVDVSVGVAIAVPDLDDADSLLARADDALYRAKRAGRGRVEVAARPDARCA